MSEERVLGVSQYISSDQMRICILPPGIKKS
nr:MAG TPA: hypothetical protein [Caudoviricetes sp.]